MSIAEEFVPEFRRIALERLDRIEAAWQSVLTTVDDTAAEQIHREIHTLKGESRMVGFTDVHLVCHKLEDLLEVARIHGYAVDDDFDLAVNMALRFLAMLVRKKIGAQLTGIDLPGFVRQIDAIVADMKHEVSDGRIASRAVPKPTASLRISSELRSRLAGLATDSFIEYAHASGNRRARLRGSWYAIRDLIAVQRAVVGPPQLAKHAASAVAVARDLGKAIAVKFDVETAEVTTEILAATDAAILHLVRNAVDHGIEPGTVRAAAGKPPVATIKICTGMRGGAFELSVEDDGGGIDFDRVRARALEIGLVKPDETETFGPDRWVELLCHAGLSTSSHVNDLSGRGVGLNAVRATIADVGGTLTMTSSRGRGTTWTVTIPGSMVTFQAHVFRAAGLTFPIAVDATWTTLENGEGAPIIDLAGHFGLAPASPSLPREPSCTWFVRGDDKIGFLVDEPPTLASVRRLVLTSERALVAVITHEAVEGLLVRPECFLDPANVAAPRTITRDRS